MFKLSVDDEISLCLVHESFAAKYLELVTENYDALARWLQWPRYCKSEQDFINFIKGCLHDYVENKCLVFAIQYQGEIVGNCGFNRIDQELQVGEIGYWLSQPYQGKGIVTRCCQFLINHAFTTLNLDKVQIGAAENNGPSRAVCERLGLTLEGIITNREKVGDQILDHAIYGIHRKDQI